MEKDKFLVVISVLEGKILSIKCCFWMQYWWNRQRQVCARFDRTWKSEVLDVVIEKFIDTFELSA